MPLAIIMLFAFIFLTIHETSFKNLNANLTIFQLSVLAFLFCTFLLARQHTAIIANFLFLDKNTTKWVIFFYVFTALIFLILYALKTTKLALIERDVCLFFLFLFWSICLAVSSIFALILILELSGIALSIILVYQLLLYQKKLEANIINNAVLYQFLNSLLIFLWVSALSLLWLLWFLFLALPQTAAFDFISMNLTNSFNKCNQHISYLFSLFGLAFSLKLMLFPWQTVMISFYSGLSFYSFTLYLVTYYVCFLFVSIKLIFTYLILFLKACLWSVTSLSPLLILALLVFTTKTNDIKFVLTISSILSIVLIIFAKINGVLWFSLKQLNA